MKVTQKMMENLTGMVADVAAIERKRVSDSSQPACSVDTSKRQLGRLMNAHCDCPACGKSISNMANFCQKCGIALSWKFESQQNSLL